jgi:hypothetical protein
MQPLVTGQPSVQGVTINSVLKTSGFERISILKIDIEGGERELFSGPLDWLEATDNIVIELHGADCARIFFDAVKQHNFEISTSRELTVCMRDNS